MTWPKCQRQRLNQRCRGEGKGDAHDNGYYGTGRDDTSQSATREGASAGLTFKDNTVERQRRVVARWDGRTRQ